MLEIKNQPSSIEVAKKAAQAVNLSFQYETRLYLDLYNSGEKVLDFFNYKVKNYTFITVKYEDNFCLLIDFINELRALDLAVEPVKVLESEDLLKSNQYRYEKRTGQNKNPLLNRKQEEAFNYYAGVFKSIFTKEHLDKLKENFESNDFISTNNGYLITIDKI